MFRKMSIVFTILIISFTVIFIRLLYLSTDSETLSAAAKEQSTNILTISKMRGNIYDRNNNKMVSVAERYVAAVNPVPKAVNAIAKTLDDVKAEEFFERADSGKPFTMELNDKIQEEGITVFSVFDRYTDDQSAAHIIGYTGYDGTGVTGIEKAFDDWLSEKDSQITVSYPVNAVGTVLSGIGPNITDTSDNTQQGVVLTLDNEVQKIAEEAAKRYIDKGAIVIMKAGTGDILASVSAPAYSPNNIADYIDDEDSALLNRAFSAYNVGSVFKLVVAASALENNISPGTEHECNGYVTVGSNTFYCNNRAGHGTLNLSGAIAKSCNPYFIELGQELGGDNIFNMASALGFGKANYFASDYASASGTLPDKTMLSGAAVTANFSFGQGELTASPVQICSLINTIASDGEYYTPRLVLGQVDTEDNFNENQSTAPVSIFSEDTATKLKEYMSEVLKEDGTGYSAQPYNTIACGKTGTAQTGRYNENDEEIEHSWFAGFFPYLDPKYVVVVLAEDNSQGNETTCPAFKYIAERIVDTIEQ